MSGVFPQIRFLLVFLFCIIMTSASSHRMFSIAKSIFIKPYFIFLKLSEKDLTETVVSVFKN